MKLFATAALLLTSMTASAADLQLVVYNAKSKQGHVLVSIFDDADAFPDHPERAVKKLKLTLDQAANYLVTDLAPGEYAIAILHDQNDNGKMDKNGVGLPKEGFAFSNNSIGTFGPPSFKKAKFEVKEALVTQQIKLKYF